MKKVLIAVVFSLFACTRTQTPTTLRTFPAEVDGQISSINLEQYAPPPMPDLTAPVTLSSMITDSSTGAAQGSIREGTRIIAPFDGVCLNNEAESVIESTINEHYRESLNERRRAVAEANARALRDLQTLQNDYNLSRTVFQSRIRDRDNEINNGNRIIQTLERNNVNNVWYNMGWVAAGAAIGIVASSVYLLVTH